MYTQICRFYSHLHPLALKPLALITGHGHKRGYQGVVEVS